MTVLSVSVFGPESVSYERSRRENRAKFHEISARAFFGEIPKSQYSLFFRILFLKNVRVPKCPGRARAGPILGLRPGPCMGLAYIGMICMALI